MSVVIGRVAEFIFSTKVSRAMGRDKCVIPVAGLNQKAKHCSLGARVWKSGKKRLRDMLIAIR